MQPLDLRLAYAEDIPGVMNLQQRYVVTNLTPEAQKEGFVTTPFTERQLENLMEDGGLYVARTPDEVIAYLCAGSWSYFSQWPIFPFILHRLPHLSFQRHKLSSAATFQYGPVCIDLGWRGQGILAQLFELMRLDFKKKYPTAITFINKINKRSINAHIGKLYWKIIDDFEFNQRHYFMLAFDMQNSVLEDQTGK